MKQFFTVIFWVWVGVAWANVQADFTSDKTKGCPPLIVEFTDQSSSTAISWNWDFGNGNTSVMQNPSASFLEPGDYSVKLIVQDHNGVTDSIIRQIKVFKLPVIHFYVDKPKACSYDSVKFFPNVTPGDAPISKYGWGFGNGVATTTTSPKYKYPTTGSYNITLVVEDTNGCVSSLIRPGYVNVFKAPTANFTAYPTKTCNPSLTVNFNNTSTGAGLTYYWDYDGTNYSTDRNPPPFTYVQQKYNVGLTVTDSNGCVSKKTVPVQATKMQASLKPSKYIVCTGEVINFTNTSNFPGTQWSWTFGDSTGSNLRNPSKVYYEPGIYDVSLSIKDGECEDSVMMLALLTVTPGKKISDIAITADAKEACKPPLKVNFGNQTPPGDIMYIVWKFGDGNVSTDWSPTHTYTTTGSFTITVSVMDSGGCISTATFPNFINIGGPPVNFNNAAGCFGTPYNFKNTSSGVVSYLWTFHDGTTSTAVNPTKTYPAPGTYSVTLKGTSAMGCEKTVTKTITLDTVHVDFEVNSTFSPCPPFVALFKNTSKTSGLTYSWEFGDGYKDNKVSPTHIYHYPGKYSVKLTGTNKNGCKDVAFYEHLIEVQGPSGKFSATPKKGCTPLEVKLTAEPSSNTKAFWCDLGDGNIVQDSTHITHTYNEERVYYPKFILVDHIGCSVSYPQDSIIVQASPTLEMNDTSICRGQTAAINVVSNGLKFQWTPSTFLDCDTCKNVTTTTTDTIQYELLVTNQVGCQSKKTISVNVEPMPELKDTLAVNLCRGDEFQLFVGNAHTIEWQPSQFLDDPAIATPLCKPTYSIDYTVKGYNVLGCSVVAHVPITVKDKVDVSLPKDFGACPFDTAQINTVLNFGSVLGVDYQWSPAYYLDDATSPDPKAFMKNRMLTFQLIASGGQCEADTEQVTIFMNPLPDLEVSEDVTTTPLAEVELLASSKQKVSYEWTAAEELSCNNCRRPVIHPSFAQTVFVEVTNEFGCKTQDSVRIRLNGCDANSIYMPNTFTPNGDGLNDRFLVRSPSLTNLDYFRVFDKWGNLVFETGELGTGWDGTSPTGQMEPTAVYVYVLKGTCDNGESVTKSGNVTAIR